MVDDDPMILRSVRDALSTARFRAVATAEPEKALELMGQESPRLALLDLMLPEHDGVELMGDILSVSRIPVIFLSAYGRDETVARVLEQGATDYIVKPFSPTELVARVRAALRRFGEPLLTSPAEPFVLGDLRIDYTTRRVTVLGRTAPLTPTEFDLLAALSMEAGQVVPHDRLLRRVWSPGKPGNLRVLRTHLKHLRRQPLLHLRRAPRRLPDPQGVIRRDHPCSRQQPVPPYYRPALSRASTLDRNTP